MDVAATVEVAVHQLQQATGRMAVIEQAGRARRQESEELTNHMQIGVPTAGRMVTGKSANQQRSANKQSASRESKSWLGRAEALDWEQATRPSET